MSTAIEGAREKLGDRFIPRNDDIYIVTYPRSGTTWMQMVLYQLTTSGNMDFTHISQYIPFLERALSRGRSLEGLSSPRMLKTHWQLSRVKKWPGRFIYIARDGKDVLVSYFNFYRDYLGFDGSFDEFFSSFLAGTVQYGSWFQHIVDARTHLGSSNVLFLNYEDLIVEFDRWLDVIVRFLGYEISEEKQLTIVSRSSFPFMRQHENKFDHATEVLWERTQEISAGSFLRQGKVGSWKDQLTLDQQKTFSRASMNAGLR